jgi:UDP-N-acetylmuramoyl-L-alanyl-D-glutamate--2,6-diaminopimelate ligase
VKTLKDLLLTVHSIKVYGNTDIEVSGISDDSRRVKKGALFVAISGFTVDAHKYIPDVIKKGALVVVGEKEPQKEWLKKITYIQVENSRKTLSLLACAWFDYPANKMKVIGVTGTKGKTTVSYLIYELLKASGKKTGLVSTIKAVIGEKEYDTGLHVTNPEPLELQKFFGEMVRQNCEYAVIEVTSHGLDQGRVEGVNFYMGVLTNIAPEHLDYHKTFENYVAAKAKLFENVEVAVLNAEDASFDEIKNKLPPIAELITYSAVKTSDHRLKSVALKREMEFTIESGGVGRKFTTKLLGEYNALNCLAAIAVAKKENSDWEIIEKSLKEIEPPEGRLQKIENKKGIDIYIDFAHTPDSLENVLKLLKSTAKGRLISVFGCAGERDPNKRTKMGAISAGFADISIFTAEDPRSEDVNKIIAEMDKGAKNNKAKEVDVSQYIGTVDGNKQPVYFRVPERGEAIAFAINEIAKKGDTVVVCGKGHEKSMAYNGVEYPWSDREAIELALTGKVKIINRSG